MTEVVVVKELNGVAPGTPTSLAAIVGRYCTMDSATPGTTNPCKVPTTSFYYSFKKSMFLDVSGTFNSIRDIYWYCDGTVADDWRLDDDNGGGLFIGTRTTGDNGEPYASYAQALGVVGTSGYAMNDVTNGDEYYKVANGGTMSNADSYTAGSPLLIDSTVYTAAFTSKIWCTQLKIPPTATHGELTSKSFSLSYQVY